MSQKRVTMSSSSTLKALESSAASGSDDGESQNQGQGQGPRKDASYGVAYARKERRALVTRVIFLRNVTKVGECACDMAFSLVVVDIPEGVESIGQAAFNNFPTTLTSIGDYCFWCCESLENIDLLHTNLQELGDGAFYECSELKSTTIPDSLQTFSCNVFWKCIEVVPSHIDVSYPYDDDGDSDEDNYDFTPDVVAHLRLQQLLSGNNFLNTDNFRRLIVQFLPNDALMTMRLVSKPWLAVAEKVIDEGFGSGAMIVHDGRDFSYYKANARGERRKLVTRVIFLLNITKFGEWACSGAANLVVVDIPEGVVSIGDHAFYYCTSLTTVSFPRTLKLIGGYAFSRCSSLENVNLLHTNLQELGRLAFAGCSELKSMTIPESLQTHGFRVFRECSKLVPSSIDVND